MALANSAAMCRRQSLRLVATAHHRLTRFDALLSQSVGTAEYRHTQGPQSCRVVCVAVVALARYGHALRFYITPHFVKCAPVAALKLRLVPPTASRPCGFTKQALCKVAFAGVGRTAVGASRSHPRPTRRRLRALVVVVALWHWSGAARCALGQWPAASHVVCAPAHPCASPLRGFSPARWSARPPPVGAPSARAPLSLDFATSLVAGHARNTGATGLTACMPAWPLACF